LIAASGSFGFGKEYNELYPIDCWGGISSKGLTLHGREGNPGIRITETPSGIMNSVGLQNPGVRAFIDHELPWMRQHNTVILANLGGHSTEDYLTGVEWLNKSDIDILELNISCPNVKSGGMAFGLKAEVAQQIVSQVRKICKKPLMVKLSPNAENIIEIAKACQDAGADSLSLVNTFKAMAIDIRQRKPVFENVYAGLSGKAIKPIALRMVHEVCKNVTVPVVGIGGITTAEDVIEFMMAGCSAVQIATGNFTHPLLGQELPLQLIQLMDELKIDHINDIKGII
jgi:dihydroorotate dehydrogenase (NAD+) catalytic subunit